MKRKVLLAMFLAFAMLLAVSSASLAEEAPEIVPVSGIALSETELVLTTGSSAVITAEISPDDASNRETEWSSTDENVAAVAKGKITAKNAGECDIVCAAADGSGIRAVCHVEVRTPVRSITVNEKQAVVVIGASEEMASTRLTYTVAPEDAYWKDVTWESSDTETVTVSADGTVKGLKPGKATVTAYSTQPESKAKAQAQIVVQQAVTGIELETDADRLQVKKKLAVRANVLPEDAANRKLEWTSSDESVATVNAQGQVTGVSAGETVITAKSTDGSEVTASRKVNVYVPVSKIQFGEGQAFGLPVGLSHTFTATVVPEDATDRSLVWASSDETIATVDKNGTVTGVSLGKAKITATAADGSNTAGTITVVINKAVESITLESEQVNIPINRFTVLKTAIEPQDAGNKTLEWSSSDESVATVTKDGKVTGVSRGEAQITARATDGSGIEVSCRVTVVVPVQTVTISGQKAFNLPVGVTRFLTAKAEPMDADVKDVIWSSSNEKVAVVNENGEVSAIAKGIAMITAAAADGSNVNAAVKVSVDEYDLVFMDKFSQTAYYRYGSGMYTVQGRTRSGCVRIPEFNTSMLVLIGGGLATESFSVTPLKPGTDVITVTAGSTRTNTTVYVSPSIDFGDETQSRVQECMTEEADRLRESAESAEEEEAAGEEAKPYVFTYESELYSESNNQNSLEWGVSPQEFPLEFLYRTEIVPGHMILWETHEEETADGRGVTVEGSNDAVTFGGIPVGGYKFYFIYPFTQDGPEKDQEKAQFYMARFAPHEGRYDYKTISELTDKFVSKYGDPEITNVDGLYTCTWNCAEETGICFRMNIDDRKNVSDFTIFLGKTGYDEMIRTGKAAE